MKLRFLIVILTMLFALQTENVMAQNKKRASMEIVLSDNEPLQVSINGRLYKAINRKLVIRDIPAKNNNVEIIKKCNRNKGDNCKDQIVFSGKVKFERGIHYQAVALVGEGQLRVSDQGDLIDNNNRAVNSTHTNPVTNSPSTATTEFQHLAQIKENLPADINALGERMKKLTKDDQKVNAASAFIKNRSEKVDTDQLWAISSWIMYDENKLQFLKNVYGSVSNPENYASLQMVFTMNDYKQQFVDFVTSQ